MSKNMAEQRREKGNLVKPFLNLNKSVKCVQGDVGFRYFQYSSLLLEQLDIEHPVLQYIVGVSQEFREQYGCGTSDVLLFYIQSWTRVAEHCTKMGIPDQLVTSLMREIVNECIKHLQSSKITLDNVKSVIPRKVMDAKFSMKTQGLEGLLIERQKEDIDVQNNDTENVSRMLNEICSSDSRHLTIMNNILQSVTLSRLVNNHEERHIGKENEQNSLHKEYDENNVEVIHPEIKNDFTEETEDVSWYFDGTQTGTCCEADPGNIRKVKTRTGNEAEVGNILKVNDAADIHDSGCDEDLTETSANETSAIGTGADLEETDEITRDIDQLRLDIEADIKQLAERKDKTLTKKKNNNESEEYVLYFEAQRNTHTVDDEFDSCFDNSDSEFDSCFEKASSCKSLPGDKDIRIVDNKKIEIDADAFKTVEFRYSEEAETCLPEDKYVKDKPMMNKAFLMHMQNSHIENLKSEDIHEASSIDIEVRNCTSDYLKTKEILKCIGSCEEFKHYQLGSERWECQIAKGEHLSILPDKQHVSADLMNDIGCSSADQRNEHLDTAKSQNINQIKHINTLLRDVSKVSKTAISQKMQFGVHSRHFWNVNEDNVSTEENDQNVGKSSELSEAVSKIEMTSLQKSKDVEHADGTSSDKVRNVSNVSSSHSEQFITNTFEERLTTNTKHQNLKSVDALLKNITAKASKVTISEETALKASAVLLRSRHMNSSEEYCDLNDISHNMETSVCSVDKHVKRNTDTSVCSVDKHVSRNTDTFVCSGDKEFVEDWNSDHHDTAESSIINNIAKKTIGTETCDISNDLLHTCIQARSTMNKDIHGNGIQHETDRNYTLCNADVIPGHHIRSLVSRLLYGRDCSLVDVVTDVVGRQSTQGDIRLKMNTVSVYGRVGVMSKPRVIDGVIVKMSSDNVLTSQLLKKKSYNALMVNGDLSVSFHHKGYKPIKAQETVHIDEFVKRTSRSQQWQEDLISILHKLSVTLVLVKGNVSQDVQHLMTSQQIAVIDYVPYSQLEQLSEASQIDMLTYATLATQEHVCRGVTVQSLEVDWCDKDRQLEVIIKLTSNCPQTIVVEELTTTLVDLREQELWDCLHRVNSALHCGFVIPGAGISEENCCDFLAEQIEMLKHAVNTVTTKALQYRLVVAQEVMSSFIEFTNLVRSHCQYRHCALESWESKTEAWKLAIDVVSVIRNMDTFIVTGLQDNQCDAGTL